MDGSNIFDVLTGLATGERLDSILSGDVAYMETQNEIERVSAQVKGHGFSEEEMQMVDGLV